MLEHAGRSSPSVLGRIQLCGLPESRVDLINPYLALSQAKRPFHSLLHVIVDDKPEYNPAVISYTSDEGISFL